MTPDAIDETQLSSVAQALLKSVSELVSDPDHRVYVAMDGSQFDDLPKLLKAANVSHRPLYRYGGGDYTVIVGGPWLIDPYQAALPKTIDQTLVDEGADYISDEDLEAHSAALSANMVSALEAGDATGGGMLPAQFSHAPGLVIERLRQIVALCDGKPAAVFWSGERSLNSEDLYKHLRGLNRISVPKNWKDNQSPNEVSRVRNDEEVATAGDVWPSEHLTSAGQEMVIFRHADANVMMQMIPALDEAQLARLFGPATQIIFAPDKVWGGGVKRARQASSAQHHGKDVLRLSPVQIKNISLLRDEVSSQRISHYLERNASSHLRHLKQQDRDRWIASHMTEARSLGVRSEADLGRWCYLQAIAKGQLMRQPGVVEYMRNGGEHAPDTKVRLLFRSVETAASNSEVSS
ncbi:MULTISPECIES: hypothetical protein [unclassified Rhizobium]|uniref:hypothetical protein n=1 Tax=unclassified Rhizobium TaxID=2613769 RepID=UPI001786E531|nr:MULTISPECIES: hypothetical protein [unclassified Rhizobium]MBD8688224.1 hypothetical protein [Rhizobium sp. CFBP 13644]MBD8692679.1 hypothetical protein [Rhizobium sp. CFBP 13717]